MIPLDRDWLAADVPRRGRLLAAAAAALVVGTVVTTAHGVCVGPPSGGRAWLVDLLVGALWALPWVPYVVVVRTRAVSLLGGLALGGASAALLQSIYTAGGSTAAVGLLFAPPLLGVVGAATVLLDLTALWLRSRRVRA